MLACRSRGSLKVIPGPYLLQLPLTFDGLPQDLASRVFQDQPPVPSRYDMAELLQLVKLSPMRNTHRLVDNRITGSKVQGIPGIFSLLQQALGQPLGPAAPSRGSLRLQNGETLPLITGPASTVAPSLPRGVSWSSGSAKDRCLPDHLPRCRLRWHRLQRYRLQWHRLQRHRLQWHRLQRQRLQLHQLP